jgi:hypothetical protein
VAMVVAVFGILVPPAIHASRFHSRVASCQDGLRQLGLALSLYGYHHGSDLSDLADNERLTTAGQFVADLLDNRLAPDDGRTICPEAWLIVPGMLRWPSHLACWRDGIDGGMAEASEPAESLPTGTWAHIARLSNLDWSGVERNGTIDGSTDSPPAAVALLADAPSADVPDQALDYHDGQGRNRFFEDGHVDFHPCSTPRDLVSETMLPRDDSPATPAVTVPVRFAGWH